jgi:predicted O-methyltransferase YrrM
MQPRLVVELGTCTGGSTSYLGAASPTTRVISVDIVQHHETAKRLAYFPNVELWADNTNDPALYTALEKEGPIDILFIDTEHTLQNARAEYDSLSTLVRSGGVILFDDTRMNGMSRFWQYIKGAKQELNHLHWSGFGIAQQ